MNAPRAIGSPHRSVPRRACGLMVGLTGALLVACSATSIDKRHTAAGPSEPRRPLGQAVIEETKKSEREALPSQTTVEKKTPVSGRDQGGRPNLCPRDAFTKLALPAGRDNQAPPKTAKPVKGKPFSDPVYGTCIVRLTDHANEPPVGFARNDYARRQAFNADNSRVLIYSENGHWHLYDAVTYAWIRQLAGLAGDAEPQWHPTNPDLMYFLPTNGGLTVNELNVETNRSRVVASFANRLPWKTAAHVWTKSEGSPSADGRYWGFMVDDVNWASLGAFTWDMQTDTILGTMNFNGRRPDNVSISPTGKYILVSWLDGTWSYTRDFSSRTLVNALVEHADIALDANGDDAYVAVDYKTGWVFTVNLRTGVRTNLFECYPNRTATAFHFSGKAYQRPGWVLVSTYADYNGERQWLHRKVYAVELKANPRIYHLAHHHSVPNGYWTEPHASVNRDFTRISFSSNWDINSKSDIDAYMIELPSGAIPKAAESSPRAGR